MRRIAPHIAFVVLALLGVTILVHSVAHAAPSSCPPTVVLAVDGTRDPGRTPTSIDRESPLAPIAAALSSPDAAVRHVEYPGDMIAGVNGWELPYDASKSLGRGALRDEIRETEQQCPGTRFHLIGYSQGAAIVGDVAAEIDADGSSDLRERVTVTLIADPRQPGTGVEVVYAGLVPAAGVTMSGERPAFHTIAPTWICNPTDVCDARGRSLSEIVAGWATVHTAY